MGDGCGVDGDFGKVTSQAKGRLALFFVGDFVFWFWVGGGLEGHGGYEYVHHDEVADASAHDEEVEDLVGTEVFVF